MMKRNSEDSYIKRRKRIAAFNRICYQLCSIFPIKVNRIAVCTFEGKGGFGCNPKYIVEELYRRNENYEIVWFLDDISKEFPSYVKKIKNTWWNRLYWLSTSKIWIDNYRKPFGTRKRKEQCYINTWHGTLCIKPIGEYRGSRLPKIAYLVSMDDSRNIDYVVSGSKWCDEHYPKGLIYDGKILRTGSPRCDILIHRNEDLKREIRESYHVPSEAKILMYAPTFRGGSQNTDRSVGTGEMQIDFTYLIDALEKKFGGVWYIFLRLHPQLAAKKEYCKTKNVSERLIDVTQHPDMNYLMSGIDAFITDYSSAVFEACLMRIPCFLYADDLNEYIEDRGKLFFDMYSLPFSVAVNNRELIENVKRFDNEKYQIELSSFIEDEGITEDGFASSRIADLIENFMKYRKVKSK